MNMTLSSTTSSAIAAQLTQMRRDGGSSTLGRVLTLVIVADDPDDVETAISTANGASREHPCRVVVVVADHDNGPPTLDAEIRVGGEEGASEVIVLWPRGEPAGAVDTLVIPLLLSDTPVVVWWTGDPPPVPSLDTLGQIAQRRITNVIGCADPLSVLEDLAPGYHPGDTDLSWARVTLWRGLLAAAMDEPPHERITAATVRGAPRRPSVYLLAGWLSEALRLRVAVEEEPQAIGLTYVGLQRASGTVSLHRASGESTACLHRPGRVDQHINLSIRSLTDCLTEELRRLDADETYGRVLTRGLQATKTIGGDAA